MSIKDIAAKLKERYKDKIDLFEKSKRRLYITIKKEEIRDLASFMSHDLGARLAICSGVETSHNFEVLYHFALDSQNLMVTLRALISKDEVEIDSISDIIAGSQWIELETNELLGINFKGNPRTKRFLLADDWPDGVFPLRKTGEGQKHG